MGVCLFFIDYFLEQFQFPSTTEQKFTEIRCRFCNVVLRATVLTGFMAAVLTSGHQAEAELVGFLHQDVPLSPLLPSEIGRAHV